ncbi:aminoglycoside phosphotransferase family protein [Kitasatospora camelliae]|uniref:Aminoglycoside phosphotransferase family protein n=1 Tax=Kitasatospora camelliae TaxID=3156397 RepID=A0AAU8K468_9ACTN
MGLHAGEPEVDAALVRRLLRGRFPHWAERDLVTVGSAGTSNQMYRLGPDLVVRLPRTEGAARDIAAEHHWLPRLAPALPVAVPEPVGLGEPAEGFPWAWSVYRWLPGRTATPDAIAEPDRLARDLGAFLTVLRGTDPAGAPPSFRSEPLTARDPGTRENLADVAAAGDLGTPADLRRAHAVWEAALAADPWPGPPVWLHADLQPGNLLLHEGRLSAVIDFGCFGLGDPAVDLIAAWYVLPAASRALFRTSAGADDATWARARGWTLSIALAELRYYRRTRPDMTATARRTIAALLG